MYSSDVVNRCQDRAAQYEYRYFGVESEDECYTAADAGSTYSKHGSSSKCSGGVGGNWALDVYKIVPCESGNVTCSTR